MGGAGERIAWRAIDRFEQARPAALPPPHSLHTPTPPLLPLRLCPCLTVPPLSPALSALAFAFTAVLHGELRGAAPSSASRMSAEWDAREQAGSRREEEVGRLLELLDRKDRSSLPSPLPPHLSPRRPCSSLHLHPPVEHLTTLAPFNPPTTPPLPHTHAHSRAHTHSAAPPRMHTRGAPRQSCERGWLAGVGVRESGGSGEQAGGASGGGEVEV
eukprot:1887957-Rhodomonas_salina.1